MNILMITSQKYNPARVIDTFVDSPDMEDSGTMDKLLKNIHGK